MRMQTAKPSNKIFRHCLRLQITCDDRIDEIADELTKHCKKYGFTDVMLMINAEEFNVGHIEIENAAPWVEALKSVKRKLEKNGIVASVNNWMEMGHLDRQRRLTPSQSFTTMADKNGKKCSVVACPLSLEWRKYYTGYASYLVRELSPDVFWIEDDFRYHNHGNLEWGGCFCDEHIAVFNKIAKKNYSRDEWVEKIFKEGKPTEERKIWLDFSRKSLTDTAKIISESLREIKPDIKIGLMSSTPEMHAMEGRRWDELLSVFAGDTNIKINRIHLPCYNEMTGKDYYFDFNAISMTVRAFCTDDTVVLPETENGSANVYRKSPAMMRFQVESSIPLVLSGMTYSIYDFVGNGVVEDLGYAKEIKKLTPYLQAVTDLELKFSSLSGAVVPIDERCSYNLPLSGGIYGLLSSEFKIGGYMSAQGVSYRYDTEKKYDGETVALIGDSVYDFTNDEIIRLFSRNSVIVDGYAASVLTERGIGKILNIEKIEFIKAESTPLSYEEAEECVKIYGKGRFRASCRENAGDYYKIEYVDEKALKKLTSTYDYETNFFGNGITEGKNLLIIPYDMRNRRYGQFSELRRKLLLDFIEKHTKNYVTTEFAGVSPYLFDRGKDYVLIVTNANLDNFKTLKIKTDIRIREICEITKKGIKEKRSFKENGNEVEIKTSVKGMETATFIIKSRQEKEL